jgi:GDSL-like Lipase/Acylhydrolase family
VREVWLDPDDPQLSWDGLVDLRRAGDWWQPWRLPADRIPTTRLNELARMPAGVRVGMRTDARLLSVPLFGDPDYSMPVDVLVDGQLAHRMAVRPGEQTLTVALPGQPANVDVWLPNYGRTKVGRLRLAAHSMVRPMNRTGPHWMAYGSALTQCRLVDGPSQTWPAELARRHGWRLTCLGFSGECHLDPVVARTIREQRPDLVTLCVGLDIHHAASFSRRTLGPALTGFLDMLADQPVVVITPPLAPAREQEVNAVGLTLADIRGLVAKAASGVSVIDGRDLVYADLLLDGLHLGPDGYQSLAERISPLLAAELAQKPAAAYSA